MTLFGKILVCVNLVFSLMMAAWALGVYTQRINWTTTPPQATPEQAAGTLAVRQADVKRHWASTQLAEVRQQAGQDDLRVLEEKRPADKAWYDKQLDHMRRQATEANPVKGLSKTPEGKLIPDNKNNDRPTQYDAKDAAGLPLQSYDYYNKQQMETYDLLRKEEARLIEITQLGSALSRELSGDKDKGLKGLEDRIDEEEFKRQLVEEEIRDIVEPAQTNVRVESELLIQRREELRERRKELLRALEELKKNPAARPQ